MPLATNTLFIVFIACLFTSSSLHAQLVISEVGTSSSSTYISADGESVDWIEIQNRSDSVINCKQYFLSDTKSDFTKWQLPNITLGANEYFVCLATGLDTDIANEYHTNFKIKNKGEKIYLNSPTSQLECFEYPELQKGTTYGKVATYIDHLIFPFPTPGADNLYSTNVKNDRPSGFYDQDITIDFVIENGFDVYYTTDGSIPNLKSKKFENAFTLDETYNEIDISNIPTTPLSGPYQYEQIAWQEPTHVKRGVVLRYCAFKDGVQSSHIKTNTYWFFKEENDFPTVSIATDPNNLFDYETGIFIPGKTLEEKGWDYNLPMGNYKNEGKEWEREVRLLYFDSVGNEQFSCNAGIRMHGNGSLKFAQKPFKVYFREEYGDKESTYPFFGNNSASYYKKLVFRNSGNDCPYTHFQDAFLQSVLSKNNTEKQAFQMCNLYINGEFWGIYNMREKFDEHYFAGHFNIDKDFLEIRRTCGIRTYNESESYNNLLSFLRELEPDSDASYAEIKEHVDVESFADYYVAQIYLGNSDWPGNNYMMWRDVNQKWRWALFDLDYTLGQYNYGVETNNLETSTDSISSDWPNFSCSTAHSCESGHLFLFSPDTCSRFLRTV